MIEIVPFNPAHLKHIEMQHDQTAACEWFDKEDYHELLLAGEAYTALHDGEVILCAGVFPTTKWIGTAWALVSACAGPELLRASRAITDFLKKTSYARIETPVRRGFVNGHRWCRLMGFTNETPDGMKYYGLEGETYDLYAYYPKELKRHGKAQPVQETKST
ncbi:MAG: hypothetical protein ACPGQQ_02970 [Candidatus Puniceispirillaceae bacterium]